MPPVAIVTGSARRIGAATARHLHGCGLDVVIHHRSSTAMALELVTELNSIRHGSAIEIQADLSNTDGCYKLARFAGAWKDQIDFLVNNASTFFRTPFESVDESQWNNLIDGNLRATFFVTQAVLPWLRRSPSASIVNICDVRTDRPLKEFSVYTASKAGIVALTRALAVELSPTIRVNAVSPGSLDWPTQKGIFRDDEIRTLERSIPLQRLGTGADIATAIEFLLLRGQYVTGHVLAVDGGSNLI